MNSVRFVRKVTDGRDCCSRQRFESWSSRRRRAPRRRQPVLHYFGAALGLGMIVIGAALGIGTFAAAAAEGIARQPAAAAQITGAVNLPLFLLEGVAILAEVFVLLIVLMNGRA